MNHVVQYLKIEIMSYNPKMLNVEMIEIFLKNCIQAILNSGVRVHTTLKKSFFVPLKI